MSSIIKLDGVITGSLSPQYSITGEISPVDIITGELSVDVLPDLYEGSYEVIPKVKKQYLYTRDKWLKDDVTVHDIPYDEVSNTYGTTVTIAS